VVASQDMPFSARRTSSAAANWHADRYSLQTFELGRMRIAGAAADLTLLLAIACRVDR